MLCTETQSAVIMSRFRDAYTVLGIRRGASMEEVCVCRGMSRHSQTTPCVAMTSDDPSLQQVKHAYRQLCKTYHPDLHATSGDVHRREETFKEITEAYRRLMSST